MKLAMRYGLAAILIVVAIVLLVPPFAGSLIEQWSKSDVESRSVLAFNSALDEFTSLLNEHDSKGIVALFERMALDEELLAVGFCNDQGELLYPTKEMPKSFTCKEATLRKTPTFSTLRLGHRQLLVSSFPIGSTGERGHVVLVHDLALVEQRGAEARMGQSSYSSASCFLPPPSQLWSQCCSRAVGCSRCGARSTMFGSAAAACSPRQSYRPLPASSGICCATSN